MMIKKQSEIFIAEWIVYRWFEVTEPQDEEPKYLRGYPRPLDEAMGYAGGTIEKLRQYLWVLDEDHDIEKLALKKMPGNARYLSGDPPKD